MLSYYGSLPDPVWTLNFRQRVISYIRKIFDRKLTGDGNIDKDTFLYNADQLIKGIEKGFDTTMTDASFRDGRLQLMQRMRRNTFTFAAFKSHSNIAQIVNELKDPKGKLRSFAQFKKAALKIDKDYNVHWLKTEYNTTIASSQMADKWLKIEKRKDILPWLEYKTQEDNRVRHSHELLNGTVKKVDDPFWDTYYPPNGWGCRCYVLQHADATEKDPQGYPDEKQMPPAFRINPGKTGTIFGQEHPYFKLLENDRKKQFEIIRSLSNILQYEDIYDTIFINKHSGNKVLSHITHTGKEFISNTEMAKLLSENHNVKLLPTAYDINKGYPDMMLDDKIIAEYKQISTSSVSNAKRNAIKKAVMQYNKSEYKKMKFFIILETINLDKKQIRNLINRSFAQYKEIDSFIIKRNNKISYFQRND